MIIGIVILSILGLLLFLAMIVLFLPITYTVHGNFDGKKYYLYSKVNWLFGLVSGKIKLNNEGYRTFFRFFWIKRGDRTKQEKKPDPVVNEKKEESPIYKSEKIEQVKTSDIDKKKKAKKENSKTKSKTKSKKRWGELRSKIKRFIDY
jgi:hypothetical protein